MKALTAQVVADEGDLFVLGYRLPDDSKQARADVGVVAQLDNLDVTLTVEQNLLVFAHLYRVPASERGKAIQRALEIANLGDRRGSVLGRTRSPTRTSSAWSGWRAGARRHGCEGAPQTAGSSTHGSWCISETPN
jgi:ABC-type multidrug transport system ATPase subunit